MVMTHEDSTINVVVDYYYYYYYYYCLGPSRSYKQPKLALGSYGLPVYSRCGHHYYYYDYDYHYYYYYY